MGAPQQGAQGGSSSRERTRRWRRRLAGHSDPLAPPRCPQCGRQVRSARTAPLCSRCWKLSDAGRATNRKRMRKARAKPAQ
jgi:hypothetical protein